MDFRKFQKGSSLIEMVIAVLILSFMGTAVVLLSVQVNSANNLAKEKNQARTLSEQAIEQVRSYYQTNGWDSLWAKGGSGTQCYRDPVGWNTTSVSCGTGTVCTEGFAVTAPFRQWLKLTQGSNNIKIESVILWVNKGTCFNSRTETYFFNY